MGPLQMMWFMSSTALRTHYCAMLALTNMSAVHQNEALISHDLRPITSRGHEILTEANPPGTTVTLGVFFRIEMKGGDHS